MKKLFVGVGIIMNLLGLLNTPAMTHENVKPLQGDLVRIDLKNNLIVVRTLIIPCFAYIRTGSGPISKV